MSDIDALAARLYAALKHEKSCMCGECSGGLNAVDDLVALARTDGAATQSALYFRERAERAEARATQLETALKFYADDETYLLILDDIGADSTIDHDQGDVARAALDAGEPTKAGTFTPIAMERMVERAKARTEQEQIIVIRELGTARRRLGMAEARVTKLGDTIVALWNNAEHHARREMALCLRQDLGYDLAYDSREEGFPTEDELRTALDAGGPT